MATMTETKTLYISGGMSGLKNLNFQAFFNAERKWKERGYNTVNPARMDEDYGDAKIYRWADGTIKQVVPNKGFNYAAALRRDLEAIRQCEGIVLLKGWENSNGARIELQLALELGLEIFVDGCE